MTDAVDPTGAETTATYNNTQTAAVDLPDTVTQVERLSGGGTANFTTDLSYDSQGDVTGTTNEQTGATTHITYGPFDTISTSSDALGNTTTNTFDDTTGNLLSTTSAAGTITDYGYDDNNNLISVTPIDPSFSFVLKGGPLPPAGSTFSYDSFGNLQTSTSPTGVTTGFNYDPNGNETGSSFTWKDGTSRQVVTTGGVFDPNDRQTQSIDQYGHPSATHFDVAGNVTETDDVLGSPTASIFDAANQVIRTTTPDGLITDTVYDPEGRTNYTDDPHVAGQADVHGTHTIYDSAGRVIETDRLDNIVIQVSESNGVWSSQFVSAGTILSTTASQYNDLGQVTQSTDAANQTSYFQYDMAGNQTFATDPLQETTQTLYDLAGRTVGTVDALGHVTQYILDPDGRNLRTIYADGTYSQTASDFLGRQSSVTDQMGRTVQYQYNRYGQMTAVVQPAVIDPGTGQLRQALTQYSYDIYGDLTQIEDANQHFTTFSFDPFGHQLSRTLPMQQTETSTFDNYGREATHTDFKGQQEVFGYDNLGRLDSKTFYAAGSNTAGETVVYHFDSWGRNDMVTDTIAGQDPRVTGYGFDLDNHVTSIITPEGTVNYAYDPATGFHTQTWTANSAITYTPDALQRVAAVTVTIQNGVTLGTPLVTDYYYTAIGTIDHITYPNGTETDYGYNNRNQVITVSNIVSGTGALLSSYTYALDQSGLRTGVTERELESDGSISTVVKAWDYDALERLTEEDVTVTGSVPYSSYADTYVYDLVGNRLSKTDIQGTTTVVTSAYNNNDELTSDSATVNGNASYQSTYDYDANGSQVSIVRTGTGAETDSYGYDLQNRLSTANISRTESGRSVTIIASYMYDDSGPRAQQVVTINGGSATTTAYLVDPSNPTGYSQVLEEHTNGSATPNVSYFIGVSVLGQNSGAGLASYLMPDAQGSTRLVTNVSGGITARPAYDGYGNLLGMSVGVLYPPVTVVLFDGQRFDTVLLQYYLRARYYNQTLGRFGAQDPFAGQPTRPISLHRYLYASDSPISRGDPSGQDDLLSLALNVGLFAGLAGSIHGAILGARAGVLGALKGALIGAAVGFAAGFAAVYVGAGIAWVGLTGLGAFGYSLSFVTALNAILLAGSLAGTGLSIWDIYNAKDPYERAASISDLVLSIVGWGLLVRALRTPVPAPNAGTAGRIIGVSLEQQSSIARAIRGINVDGRPAVTTIEAFGSRAGGTYRGRPANQGSDLDLFITMDSDVVNSPEKVGYVRQQLEEIAALYGRAQGVPLEIITEIDAIAPNVKGTLDDTPFIPLDESH